MEGQLRLLSDRLCKNLINYVFACLLGRFRKKLSKKLDRSNVAVACNDLSLQPIFWLNCTVILLA